MPAQRRRHLDRRRRGLRLPVRAQDHPRRLRRQGRVGRPRRPTSRRVAFDAAAAAGVEVLAEELVDFRRELSALVARSPSGQAAAYPVVASTQLDGICHEVIAPAPDLAPALAGQAQEIALRIAGALDVTGILAVELFETTDGRILVNELAMRPHNTGHWSQDGAVTSQFENHLRAVMDLPLGSPAPREPLDRDGQHPRRTHRQRPPVRRPAARDGARPAPAGAPLRQGPAPRAARSATSTPTATTSTTASSGRGTPPPGSAATWATRASEQMSETQRRRSAS